MSKRVRIEQFDQDVMVEDGDTILQAALDAGLDYPFMCQQGQCGACKSQLISGSVDLGTYYNPMILTEEERAGGQILACQAEPQSDCVVSIGVLDGEVSHVVRRLDYEVVSIERDAQTIVLRLKARSSEPFHFSAGQFACLSFGDAGALEAGMANRPDDKTLEFHLPIVADHPLSRHAAGLAVGAVVEVEGPFGAAYLREEHLGPIILAGAGADSAMLLAIAETALKAGMAQQISLFAGAGGLITSRAMDLQNRTRNFRWYPVTTGSAPVDQLWSAIDGAFDDFEGFHVYLAGAPGFREALRERFVAQGLPRESCHFDAIESIG